MAKDNSMQFPNNCPARFQSLILSSPTKSAFLSEKLVGSVFKIKVWKFIDRGDQYSLGLSLEFFSGTDGQEILKYPKFPQQGSPRWEEETRRLKEKIVTFKGWLNLKIEDLTEGQVERLSQVGDGKYLTIYGNYIAEFNAKKFMHNGQERETVELELYQDPETFRVGGGRKSFSEAATHAVSLDSIVNLNK